MTRTTTLVLAAALAASLSAACSPRHVQPFTPRQRVYKPGAYAQQSIADRPTNGSLFSEATPGYLEDTRAVRVGDFLLIRIDEQANAQGTAGTHLKKESDASSGATALLGIVPALKRAYPALDTEKLFEYASKSNFAGDGDTARKGELKGAIAVRISSAMPNGDLYIEGTKVVLINNEEYHLYVSGLVRRADIAPDNTIPSSRIADAQIEFTGRGDLADNVERGWLSKMIDAINPF